MKKQDRGIVNDLIESCKNRKSGERERGCVKRPYLAGRDKKMLVKEMRW